MSGNAAVSPLDQDLDTLASLFEEWKYGTGKQYSIIRSSSSIVSISASVLLVWILFRSRNGINTTHHRLLLCLSISDILYSLSQATFSAVVPSEMSYAVWNARGNRASCDAFGFLYALGAFSGHIYMCSLNLYYLAKVKHNKTDYYIEKKLEPWLVGVPTLYGLIVSTVIVAKEGMNASVNGVCLAGNAYYPPHCDGYEDGEIPLGFETPCGRGRSVELVVFVTAFITMFLVPITIGCSLWAIYRSVLRAEQRVARYGAGALRPNRAQATINDAAATNVDMGGSGGGRSSSILLAVSRFGRRVSGTSSNNQDSSQSRAVLHKAAAYSVGYFFTWIWNIIAGILTLAGAWPTEFPLPKWVIAYTYVWRFFAPLQGLWTFLTYMQPKVIKRKRSSDRNISWFRAFADALWPAVTGANNSTGRGENRAGRGAPGTAAASGGLGSNLAPASGAEGRNTSATISSTVVSSDRQRICARDPGRAGRNPFPASGASGTSAAAYAIPRENRLVRPADEEEKKEIETYEECEEEKGEIEPHEEEEGVDNEAGAGAGTAVSDGYESSRGSVVGDGFESSLAHLRGRTAQGAGTVVGDGFESFLAYLRGHTDPQGGLAREEPMGLQAEGVEEEQMEIEECCPRESGSSSYYSPRDTGASYFSTRETLSSYHSARGTKSDNPNDE